TIAAYRARAQSDAPMPRVADAVPGVPPELAAIVDRCLHKRPAERFADASAVVEALERLLPGAPLRALARDQNPYPGLSAFQQGDADRFFGRERDVARALERIREQPLVAIAGPSGVGKSSFVRAGVVPA